jgi:hypothetical protein
VEGLPGWTRLRPSLHSVVVTLTRPAYDLPAPRFRPSFGIVPMWQPVVVQFEVRMGWTAPENEALALPHVQVPAEQVCPGAQTLPHVPQLEESVCALTQDPLQSVCPAPH